MSEAAIPPIWWFAISGAYLIYLITKIILVDIWRIEIILEIYPMVLRRITMKCQLVSQALVFPNAILIYSKLSKVIARVLIKFESWISYGSMLRYNCKIMIVEHITMERWNTPISNFMSQTLILDMILNYSKVAAYFLCWINKLPLLKV